MFILPKYILRKHAGPFIFGLAVIIFIVLANYLIERFAMLLSRDVSLPVIAEILVLSLAFTFALAVPMSVLISTLMAFGKMSADNEITAMKASGYGLHQAMIPVFLVSIVLAYLLFLFNDKVLPDAKYRLQLLFSAINKKKPTLQFQPGIFSDDQVIKDYSLMFEEIDSSSDWVYGVTIIDKSDSRVSRTVVSEKAIMTFEERRDKIILVLYNGEIHEVDNKTMLQYKKSEFEKYTIRIPVESSELERSEEGRRGDRSKSVAMMWRDIERSKKTVETRERLMMNRIEDFIRDDPELLESYKPVVEKLKPDDFVLKENGIYFIDNYKDDPVIENINSWPMLANNVRSDISTIDNQVRYQNKLLVEIYKKYSIPFACIVFIFVGVPLGVKARHGGVAIGTGLSMFFFLLYWCFLIGGEQLADRRIIPPWLAMWSANIVVGFMGIWMTVRMIHETTFLESGRFGFIYNWLARSKNSSE